LQLEKTAWQTDKLQQSLCTKSLESVVLLQNDQYTTLVSKPVIAENEVQIRLIHPASDSDISKYTMHSSFLVDETSDDYAKITKYETLALC
jgi:hypothetical protein